MDEKETKPVVEEKKEEAVKKVESTDDKKNIFSSAPPGKGSIFSKPKTEGSDKGEMPKSIFGGAKSTTTPASSLH